MVPGVPSNAGSVSSKYTSVMEDASGPVFVNRKSTVCDPVTVVTSSLSCAESVPQSVALLFVMQPKPNGAADATRGPARSRAATHQSLNTFFSTDSSERRRRIHTPTRHAGPERAIGAPEPICEFGRKSLGGGNAGPLSGRLLSRISRPARPDERADRFRQ